MKATFRPLVWSGPSTPPDQRRSRWTFKAPWSSTLTLLDQELWHLDGRDIVIEADFREQDIRRDGMPRDKARTPVHPGIRVAFNSTHGPLIYATDSCEFWQHNVRSVALGLEALRAVDRYGVTRRGEQYTGWKAISGGTPMPSGPLPMSYEAAVAALSELAGRPLPTGQLTDADRQAYYRDAARRHHPDVAGHRAGWDRLEAAMRALR